MNEGVRGVNNHFDECLLGCPNNIVLIISAKITHTFLDSSMDLFVLSFEKIMLLTFMSYSNILHQCRNTIYYVFVYLCLCLKRWVQFWLQWFINLVKRVLSLHQCLSLTWISKISSTSHEKSLLDLFSSPTCADW